MFAAGLVLFWRASFGRAEERAPKAPAAAKALAKAAPKAQRARAKLHQKAKAGSQEQLTQ